MTKPEPKPFMYPPELLPSPDEDDEVEVVVIDPDTGKATVVFPSPPSVE